MQGLKLRLAIAVAGLLALVGWMLVPDGIYAARLFTAAGDPARLADVGLDETFSASTAKAEIQSALAAHDVELAQSFVELAAERGLALEPPVLQQVAAAAAEESGEEGAVRVAGRFAQGFVTGEPDDITSLAGTVAGDLFVFGDIRDIAREGVRMARGEATDEVVLSLACVGLAITAGTYVTAGAAVPARAGLSVVKAASKAGRMSARLSEALARPLREIVDKAALKQAFGAGALLQPAIAVRAARDAVKIEKAQELVRFAGNLGRVQSKAGTRAALQGLKVAEHPADMARLARLAEAKGSKTRAIIKVLGRGAIALTYGAFQMASWIFWAFMNVMAFCATLKRVAEHTALRVIHHRKLARARAAASATRA